VNQIVQLISNPAAGRHNAQRIAELGRAFEALGAKVQYTPCGSEPPPIRADATHVCVAAGDGTVRHVAGAIARNGQTVPLSIYPLGTINLLAMEAGYPRRPADFAKLVLRNQPSRPHYPVAIGDGHFFSCAGVGPDSRAVARVSSRLKRAIGRFAYGAAMLGVLASWPRPRISLTLGERSIACEAFYVAKGRYYAGRWSFAPAARVHDPVLHVVALTKARRRDYLRFIVAVVTGSDPARLPNVAVLTCTTLRAEADEPLPVQADGDVVCTLPVTLTVGAAPLIFC
jgi:diacylglycerol kinase family enzyme